MDLQASFFSSEKKINIQKCLVCEQDFKKKEMSIRTTHTLREKCPNTEFFLVRIFPHSDWIRRDTPYLSVFSPNVAKYGPKKTPYLDTFSCSDKLVSLLFLDIHDLECFLFVTWLEERTHDYPCLVIILVVSLLNKYIEFLECPSALWVPKCLSVPVSKWVLTP